jgi:hypothetical protein
MDDDALYIGRSRVVVRATPREGLTLHDITLVEHDLPLETALWLRLHRREASYFARAVQTFREAKVNPKTPVMDSPINEYLRDILSPAIYRVLRIGTVADFFEYAQLEIKGERIYRPDSGNTVPTRLSDLMELTLHDNNFRFHPEGG